MARSSAEEEEEMGNGESGQNEESQSHPFLWIWSCCVEDSPCNELPSLFDSRMEESQSNLRSLRDKDSLFDLVPNTVFDERECYPQAHDDDIHTLVWQSPENGEFITGSKDNTLKAWKINQQGKIAFHTSLRSSGNYTSWITALICPSREEVLYGARDGTVALLTKSQHPRSIFQYNYAPSDSEKEERTKRNVNGKIGNGSQSKVNSRPICKILNQARVTTLCNLNHFDGLSQYALIGKPKEMICIEKHEDCTLTQAWKANIHSNDWVSKTSFPLIDFI